MLENQLNAIVGMETSGHIRWYLAHSLLRRELVQNQLEPAIGTPSISHHGCLTITASLQAGPIWVTPLILARVPNDYLTIGAIGCLTGHMHGRK